jgi:hypothetical protein
MPIPNLGLPVTTTGGSVVVAAFCLQPPLDKLIVSWLNTTFGKS